MFSQSVIVAESIAAIFRLVFSMIIQTIIFSIFCKLSIRYARVSVELR